MYKKIVGILICMLFIGMIFNTRLNAEFKANVVSDFESGLDGWNCNNDGTAYWESSGGNPGGFFRISESGTGSQSWAIAPSKFRGNWNNFYEISVDMKRINPTNPDQSPDFQISGPGGSATHDSTIYPDGTWKTINVILEESYWTVTSGTWSGIIADVTDFRFDAECDNSGPEQVGIDNVILSELINNPPYTPSNPNPANHDSGIDVNAELSWTGGDPDSGDTVTYDVYFGTNSNPPIVNHNQTATSFEPGTMNYNTKYYWKIVAWDNHGANTVGSIWDFTTGNLPNNPPNTPSNPNPSNHTTNVDINSDISWTGDDPNIDDTVTYDIYLGKSSDPSLVKSGHTTTSYDPGPMSSNTKYYWKIVAKDNHGATTNGPVWDFTTIYINQPPNTPSNPYPADDATGVDINADLSWTGGDPDSNDTVTYDVYFGTDSNPPQVSTGQLSTSYDPGIMNYQTKYYWKIVAIDNHGLNTIGDIWCFTIPSSGNYPPIIDIIFPEESDDISGVIIINGTASDPNGNNTLVQVEVKIDDKPWNTAIGTEYWNYSWNTEEESNGIHTVYARSYDGEIYSDFSVVNVTVLNAMPEIIIINIGGGFGIQVDVKNIGGATAYDIPWSISVEENFCFILSGNYTEDTIDRLDAGGSTIIKFQTLRGIGTITITVQADDAVKQATAFLLGPLVLRVNEI